MSLESGRRAAAIFLAVLSFGFIATFTRAASATSCAKPLPEPSVARADVIFSGQVAAVKNEGVITFATFRVSKVFKGTVPSPVKVGGGGMKGFSGFEAGRTYLVFGQISGGEIFAHLCSATMTLPPSGIFVEDEWASWSMTSLGPGAPPAASGTPPSAPPAAPGGAAPAQSVTPAPAPAPLASVTQPEPESSIAAPPPAPPPPPAASTSAPAPVPATGGGGCAGCGVPPPPARGGAAALAAMVVFAGALARRRAGRRA